MNRYSFEPPSTRSVAPFTQRAASEARKAMAPVGLTITPAHGVDNIATAISLVASTRGLSLMPAYAQNLLPWSVVSRPLKGKAPTIDLAVGYSRSNSSPLLRQFLSRLDQLRALAPAGS